MITELFLWVSAALMVPALAFALYRPLLSVLPRRPQRAPSAPGPEGPLSCALVTISTHADRALEDKLVELVALAEALAIDEVFVGLDGGELPPDTPARAGGVRVRWIHVVPRQGKNAVLNKIREAASTDVLVFTDVDARVELEALRALLEHFSSPDIGAVTGRRLIVDDSAFGRGQTSYSEFDHAIRAREMERLGSVTTCDGKLYAVRRSCFDELSPDSSDDIYIGLGAVEAGLRLTYEPAAAARIGRPARDTRHELERRRRVTTRGLLALWERRALFDPRRYGRYSVALLFNKLLRRLAAPGLLLSLVTLGFALIAALASGRIEPPGVLLLLAASVLAVVGLVLVSRGRAGALGYYAIGVLGMSLGVWDYLRGRRVSVWEPVKQEIDEAAQPASSPPSSGISPGSTRTP